MVARTSTQTGMPPAVVHAHSSHLAWPGRGQDLEDGGAALGVQGRDVFDRTPAQGVDVAAQQAGALDVEIGNGARVAIKHQYAVAGGLEQAAMAQFAFVQCQLRLAQRQVRAHARHQLLNLEGLADAIDAAGGKRRNPAVDVGQGRHEDDRDIAIVVAVLQAAAGLEAVDIGHHDVEQDQVRTGKSDPVERLEPAKRHQDLVAVVFEMVDQDAEIGRVVVDDENARGEGLRHGFDGTGHAACPCSAHCSIRRSTAGD